MGIVQNSVKYQTSRPIGCAMNATIANSGTITLNFPFFAKYNTAKASEKADDCSDILNLCTMEKKIEKLHKEDRNNAGYASNERTSHGRERIVDSKLYF